MRWSKKFCALSLWTKTICVGRLVRSGWISEEAWHSSTFFRSITSQSLSFKTCGDKTVFEETKETAVAGPFCSPGQGPHQGEITLCTTTTWYCQNSTYALYVECYGSENLVACFLCFSNWSFLFLIKHNPLVSCREEWRVKSLKRFPLQFPIKLLLPCHTRDPDCRIYTSIPSRRRRGRVEEFLVSFMRWTEIYDHCFSSHGVLEARAS